jgi:hypothetical protein
VQRDSDKEGEGVTKRERKIKEPYYERGRRT